MKTLANSLGLTYQVSLVEIDEKKFTKALREACRQALYKAARSFLLAAVPRVPILTGFASGAFGNLEDLVGRVSRTQPVSLNIRQKGYSDPTKFKANTKRTLYYYPSKGTRVVRNIVNSRPFATPSADIFSQGKARIAEGQSALFFRFSVDIKYFTILERKKWFAFKAGEAAFDATFKEEFEKLKPRIGNFLVKREIK
jgi:hypothetical protein